MQQTSKVLKYCCSFLKSTSFHEKKCASTIIYQTDRYLHHRKSTSGFKGHKERKKIWPYRMSVSKLSGCASTNKVELMVEPSGFLLVDENLQITLHGLNADQIITIHAVLNEEKKVYESCCTVQADKHGVVNLAEQPSVSGTYTGMSPMGLFWSMVPSPGQQKGIRMMKKNMDTPFKTVLYTYNGALSLEDLHGAKLTPLNVSEIDRWYKGQGVTTEMVSDGNIRGKLFLPDGPGPFPGVIDLFGTVGGITEHRAALLASRGIAALALPYFAYKDLPKSLQDISLEYFLEAVDWLLDHKKIYSKGVGVIGTSKGGDLALLMGAHSPKVCAIVNVNGCTFNATFEINFRGGKIPCVELQVHKLIEENGIYTMNTGFDYDEKDLIPVWKHNSKILNILSEDDFCSPKECIRLLRSYYPSDKLDNCVILNYDKAGHLLEPPHTPLCRMSYHKSFEIYFMWGGYPQEHAAAQEDAWKNILTFFHENIPKSHRDTSVQAKL